MNVKCHQLGFPNLGGYRNEIIVSENNNHCVSVFHPSGKKLRSFGTHGSNYGQLNRPMGLAVDDEDNILVADYKNNRIQKFSADGRFLDAFLGISAPTDIAFSSISGRIYVVNQSIYVQIFDLNLTILGNLKGLFNAMSCYNGVECDKYGRVYLAVSGIKKRIDIFSADNSFLSSFGGVLGFLCIPRCIAINSCDALLLSDCNGPKIRVFTLEGKPLGSFSDVLNCAHVHGIAFDDCDVLYVCDTGNNRICIF